ncbi:hypothetical protein ACW2AE_07760 [Limosilactobacillus fermentum]
MSAYHMLETIAKYDYPTIKGVGGKREEEIKTRYMQERKQ